MRDLRDLEQPPQAVPAEPEPAVPVRRSVGKDHLICLVCGQKQKTLKRDLAVRHELSSADYRGRYDLSSDYPLVAPSYAAQRSELARRTGLGRKPAPAAPAATARMRGATRQKGPRPVIACRSVSQVLRHASPFTEKTWSTRAGARRGDEGAAVDHDQRNDAVDALCGLFLGGLEGAGEVLSAGYVRCHPARQTKNMEYSGCGSSWATRARPMAMMVATTRQWARWTLAG
jgi:predicted transcriptional regulator